MGVTLDAVTGLPLDDSYLTQYQIPLGSQPINLEELGALGRQSNWLYPDNLPGVVSRLQARDNTNPLNAQDLSTDGKRNLNVNIAGSGTVENANATMLPNCYLSNDYGVSSGGDIDDTLPYPADIIYQLTWSFIPNTTASNGSALTGRFTIGIGGATRIANLHAMHIPSPISTTDRLAHQTGTIIWPGGMDLRTLKNTQERTRLLGICDVQPMLVYITLLWWSASGGTS